MTYSVSVEAIQEKIIFIRGERVLLDRDLGQMYGVTTKALNQAVKRNSRRFPRDFMFALNESEKNELVTNCDRFKRLRHSSAMPHAFTEQGVVMLSTVLKSEKAILVNIAIMRAFVFIRQYALNHQDLREKLDELEKYYNKKFQDIYEVINYLLKKEAYRIQSG